MLTAEQEETLEELGFIYYHSRQEYTKTYPYGRLSFYVQNNEVVLGTYFKKGNVDVLSDLAKLREGGII